MLRVARLVAIQEGSGENLLILTKGGEIGELSLKTGKIELVPYDETDKDDVEAQRMVNSWGRSYGNGWEVVVVQPDKAASSQIELRRPEQGPAQVSECKRMHCGQPALSPDRSRVAFIGQPW